MSKAERPTSKIALITGGGRGLGKAIALSLAEMGIRVVLTWNSNGATADEVVGQIRTAGGKAAALRLDVAATASFDDFFDRLQEVLQREFGATSIDFLINNAGFGQTIPIAQSTEADFDRFVNVHFKGVVFLTQMASAMVNDDGAVVYVTAAADRYHVPGYAAYAAWKGGWRCSRAMSPRNTAHAGSGPTPWPLVASSPTSTTRPSAAIPRSSSFW